MHTTTTLVPDDFSFIIDQKEATFEDVFPNFTKHDRIGIIVSEKGGSIGASALIMAAITRFYDFYRPNLGDKHGETWIYPDYFVFHIGKQHLDHFWMDIWPPHKEVVVEDDPEQILEAINDRAITRLLVEDIKPVQGKFLKETLTSAKERILTTIAYSPTGRVEKGNIQVMSCAQAEHYVTKTLKRTEMTESNRNKLTADRRALDENGNIVESYRKVTLNDALKMLTENEEQSEKTKKYLSLL